MPTRIVLAGGLALTLIAVAIVLLHAPLTVVASTKVPPSASLTTLVHKSTTLCQPGETLPRAVRAIRVELDAVVGPVVELTVLDGGSVLTRGEVGSGWYGTAVTVPVTPLRRSHSNVTICTRLSSVSGQIEVAQAPGAKALLARADGKPLAGRLSLAYLRLSRESWWAQAGAVIRHMGLGRAGSTWIVFPIVMLMLAAVTVGCAVILRELG